MVLFLHGSLIAQKSLEKAKPELISNVLVYCIKGWQFISYRTPLLDCKFEHNCSQFAIDSLNKNGLFLGTMQTTNRLIRCNPLAIFCYAEKHGYLMDDSDTRKFSLYDKNTPNNRLNPLLFSSSFIPGVHKYWAGKWSDSIFTASIIALGVYGGKKNLHKDQNIRAGINLSMASLVYVSDVYWSLRRNRRVVELVRR